jgi:hypothetical protein
VKTEVKNLEEIMNFPGEISAIGELAKDTAFSALYKLERPKIPFPISWRQKNTLPECAGRSEYNLTNSEGTIYLPRIPATKDNAVSAAHELMHFVLDMEGFPFVSSPQLNDPISPAMSDLLTDPVINQRLAPYEFDLKANYECLTGNAMDNLSRVENPPDRIARIQWVIQTVGLILEYEVITGHTRVGPYQTWFSRRYPNIGKEVAKRVEMIRGMGWNTPKKQVSVLLRLIKLYNLSHYGFVVDTHIHKGQQEP